MQYKNFEELPCWNQARELSKALSAMINQTDLRKDFSLRDQAWKACGSIMDNIAKGFDNGSSSEVSRSLGYAQRSCSELQSQLYRALDCTYISQDQFDSLYAAATECRNNIKRFRNYLYMNNQQKTDAKAAPQK